MDLFWIFKWIKCKINFKKYFKIAKKLHKNQAHSKTHYKNCRINFSFLRIFKTILSIYFFEFGSKNQVQSLELRGSRFCYYKRKQTRCQDPPPSEMEKANGRSVAAKLKNNKKAKQGHCVRLQPCNPAAVCCWVLAAR